MLTGVLKNMYDTALGGTVCWLELSANYGTPWLKEHVPWILFSTFFGLSSE
jgi:hypothetical protein